MPGMDTTTEPLGNHVQFSSDTWRQQTCLPGLVTSTQRLPLYAHFSVVLRQQKTLACQH